MSSLYHVIVLSCHHAIVSSCHHFVIHPFIFTPACSTTGERCQDIAFWKSEINKECGAMEIEMENLKVAGGYSFSDISASLCLLL